MLRASSSERKLITVLVVDIVGSTALAESMDPEEWSGIMLGAHERMKHAIHQFGGTVAQFTGDGLIAFFGAPKTREDDAMRAVSAALELQKTVEAYEQELIRTKRVSAFQARVGLHTGEVVIGDVGSAQYSEYLAVGETITLAQQIQSLAQPRAILLSDDTSQMVSHAFELEANREIEQSPGQTMRLWRVNQARTHIQRDEFANVALIGRAREMEKLRALLDGLANGHGALVSVIGEPGVGKSRLVQELRADAHARFDSLNWFEAHGVAFGGGLYTLFQQILRATLGITARDSVEAIRQRMMLGAQRQKFQDPALVVHMLELMLAIGEKNDAPRYETLRGETLQRELFETVRNTKRALAQHRPTVFVLEEMHWADAASVELTLHDADLVRELPILILATFRPDRDVPSWKYRQACAERFADVYVEVELDALSQNSAGALLDALADNAKLPSLLRSQILAKTEGNPFFMEQLLHGLIESNALVRENGNWRAAKQVSEFTLPHSLSVVLAARLDRLGEPTRRVLQAASVIGRTFSPKLLEGVIARAGWTDIAEALSLHLGILERHQLILPREFEGAPNYFFKHALIQDAAYRSLLKKRRRDLHRGVFETMLDQYGARREEHAAELAYHAQQGEEWQRAYEWARRAAQDAELVLARDEARAEYHRAVNALDKMNASETMKRNERAEIERALELIGSN